MRSSEREEVEIEDQQSVLKVEGLKAPHDICLVVGENRYPAHRVVLSARSEVFQCMLLNPQYKECKETEIQLTEEPENVFVFPQFLKYICTGEVEIAIESALPLMTLADKYDIKDLITSCRSFMAKNIAMAGSEGFLISWLQYTILFDVHKQLTDELKNFLSLNIGIVGYSKDFVDISPKNLAVLLQQNDLVVKNEATLFEIVENWLMIKLEQIKLDESCSDDEKGTYMNSLFKEICVHIRFPMMSIRELTNICLKPITAFSKKFFDDQISLAMSFHAGKPFRDEGDANEVNLQFTPRLYTSDVYCLEMNVDGIHNIDNYENSSANFSSLSKFPYTSDESTISWNIEFYPLGFRKSSFMFVIRNGHRVKIKVSDSANLTIRVRCTCEITHDEELRFKIAVLVSGCQNNITHIKTLQTSTECLSKKNQVVILEHLVPYDELSDRSVYLIGKDRDTARIQVVITPMKMGLTRDSPDFEFN